MSFIASPWAHVQRRAMTPCPQIDIRSDLYSGLEVVAATFTCLWFAMREVGIDAKLQGCTRLFREH